VGGIVDFVETELALGGSGVGDVVCSRELAENKTGSWFAVVGFVSFGAGTERDRIWDCALDLSRPR
jgi:hypothetical protein